MKTRLGFYLLLSLLLLVGLVGWLLFVSIQEQRQETRSLRVRLNDLRRELYFERKHAADRDYELDSLTGLLEGFQQKDKNATETPLPGTPDSQSEELSTADSEISSYPTI